MKGAKHFLESAEMGGVSNGPFCLYKISANGLRSLSFSAEHILRGENFINALATFYVDQRIDQYSQMRKFQRLGKNGFVGYIASKLEPIINEVFVVVDEIHVEGPISSERITPVLPHHLDYLDPAW